MGEGGIVLEKEGRVANSYIEYAERTPCLWSMEWRIMKLC